MALIGIITATQSMDQSLQESFATMGANAFSIRFKARHIHIGDDEGGRVKKTTAGALKQKQSNEAKPITFQEAKAFKERYSYPASVSISSTGGPRNTVVSNEKIKTNPNVRVIGGDENYLHINGYTLSAGRNLNDLDIQSGRNTCMIGNSLSVKFFSGNPERAIDKVLRVSGIPYRIIGVLKDKGSSSFLNADNVIITSYNNVRRLFNSDASFNIDVMVANLKDMDVAMGEAKGTFRPIRKLDFKDDDNFYITTSDSIVQAFKNSLGAITTAAVFIGLITLIGAAIGLMNIMLVAVNERTREIGLIKALGGLKKSIRQQFLFESIIISLVGAVFGIILGVLVGNLFGLVLHTGFVVPWGWAFFGIVVCSLVGLFAGLYPAYKASSLDPIVALRYE